MMKLKGVVLLLITAILWGLAFVAQTSAAENVEPFTFNASRNFVGAIFLCGVIAWRKRTGQDKPSSNKASGHTATYTRKTLLVAGIACGIALFIASYLQQLGITSYPAEAAASSRSGFVTSTYMVMVAVMGLFTGSRAHPLVFVAVGVAILGMYLLCAPHGLGGIYQGDWFVLASAFGYALHIVIIDRYTNVDGVRLSRVQLLVAGSLSLVCMMFTEQPSLATICAAALPILYAGICSDGIAYTLQIIAQQTINPTVASIIMSLEAVFAALGGWLLLAESLSLIELTGCALVFVAVLLSQIPQLLNREYIRVHK